MTLPAQARATSRWTRTVRRAETFADDLGALGAWVGPRTGPDRRTQGQKEDYVLRRLLVAWHRTGRLSYPIELTARTEGDGIPDFTLSSREGACGIEITEAGEEDYQAWLTHTARARAKGEVPGAADLPFEASTRRTADEVLRAVRAKIEKHDAGSYRWPDRCDLAIYDNTAWGRFLDKRQIVSALARPDSLLGRFRHIHLVTEGLVLLDLFEDTFELVDIHDAYEIDYARWITSQVERLRSGAAGALDIENIIEELEALGRSERRAMASHLRNLLKHLLKWEYQPKKRARSWKLSIDGARAELHELLSEMPSLRQDLSLITAEQYSWARREAARETFLPIEHFPAECPYEASRLIDPEFYPESGGPNQ